MFQIMEGGHNTYNTTKVEIAEPLRLSGFKDDSKKNEDNVDEGNGNNSQKSELTEQMEFSELGDDPKKNEHDFDEGDNDDGQWLIVKFEETDRYSAIPTVWLTKDKKCSHWPQNGFKEIATNQVKMMNQLKMQTIDGAVATTGTYSLDSIRKQFLKKTLRALMKLEDHLGDENKVGFKARVIEFLKDLGGATGHQSVNKMLARIITNSVASNFNYTGKGSKKAAFGELHIWKIISDIAVEKFKKVEGDNYDFLKAIKSCSHWLKYAPFRDAKKKKQKKTTQKTLEELAAAEESDEHHDSDELIDEV